MQHPDEGTIHAWLDGALPDEEARVVERHVADCAECAARAAEARGFVAGASRILGALDHVPAGVVPAGAGGRSRSAPRTAWWRRPAVGMAAAMTIVAVGTTMIVTRDWQQGPSATVESAAPMVLEAQDSVVPGQEPVPMPVATRPQSAPAVDESERNEAAEFRTARAPAPPPTVAGALSSREARALDRAAAEGAAARTDSIAVARAESMTVVRLESPYADTAVVVKAQADAGRRRSGAAQAPTLPSDSIATVQMPRIADARQRVQARSDVRTADSAPAIVGGHSLMQTATSLAGCYALELRQAPDAASPSLPSVVRLAVSAGDAANAIVVPPSEGFDRNQRPLLVPPALDSAQLGWRLGAADSVAVRLATDGRAVLVTFPTIQSQKMGFTSTSEPTLGFATSPELPGVPRWSGPVLVQRVPCP
jgi:hypothetical protein